MHAPDKSDQFAGQAVILFDAMCVLCSANARFVLRHDKHALFKLASMQSEAGRKLYLDQGMNPDDPDSILVIQNGKLFRDSDAVLAIYSALGWPWRIAAAVRIVPRAIRDPLYRLIARNRYRLFGKRETCWLPEPQWRDRLL